MHKEMVYRLFTDGNVTVIKSNLELSGKSSEYVCGSRKCRPAKKRRSQRRTKRTKVVDTRLHHSPMERTGCRSFYCAGRSILRKKMIGDSAVVTPEDPYVRARRNGEVAFIFDTKHAIGFVTDSRSQPSELYRNYSQ